MNRRVLTIVVLLSFSSWAMNPFEKNQPQVERGMEHFQAGEFERALEAFDAAQKELGPNAVLEANRGVTLHKLGRNEDARDALNRAIELDKGELRGRLHYNLGNVYADLKQNKEAIAEYRKALRADPNDAQARHNMEVLLRNLPPKQDSSGPDGGTPDGGKGDGGRPDAGPDGGRPDGGTDGGKPGDGGSGDAGNGDGGADAGADGGRGDGGTDGGEKGDGGADAGEGKGDGGEKSDAGEKPGDGGSSGQGGADGGADGGSDGGTDSEGDAEPVSLDGGASMSKKDAEKLLDSMKNNEKNLQLWRFQQKQKKTRNEKDW